VWKGGASPSAKRYLTYLLIAAITLLLASLRVVLGATTEAPIAEQLDAAYGGSYAAVWGIGVALVTIKDTVLLLALEAEERAPRKCSAVLLVLLWVSIAIGTTIEGPFDVAGNGWFAVWLGNLAAGRLALEECTTQNERLALLQEIGGVSSNVSSCALYVVSAIILIVTSAAYTQPTSQYPLTHGFLSSFALASAIISFLLGGYLLVVLLAEQGSLAKRVGHVASLLSLGTACLRNEISPCGLTISGFRLISVFLFIHALVAALFLTVAFSPFMHFDNGFMFSWLSVASAAMLLRDPPTSQKPLPPPMPDETVVAATLDAVREADDAEEECGYDAEGAGDNAEDGAAGSATSVALADDCAVRTAPPPPPLPTPKPYGMGLAVASLLLIIETANAWDVSSHYGMHGESTYAAVCSSLTLVGLAVRYLDVHWMKGFGMVQHRRNFRFSLVAVLAVMWLAAALTLTFVGPFVSVGNGWCASWTGAFCSGGLFFEEHSQRTADQVSGRTEDVDLEGSERMSQVIVQPNEKRSEAVEAAKTIENKQRVRQETTSL